MIVLAAGALLLAACSTDPNARPSRRYMCADGAAFFARYSPHEVMLDFGGGRSITLAEQPNAPSGTYGGDKGTFRVHWPTASLTRAGGATVSCRAGDVRDLVPTARLGL